MLCLYHKDCYDGFTAAWLVRKVYPDATFIPVQHQEPPPRVDGEDVIIVDFSYKREVLEEIKAKATTLLVLDHHETAKTELENLPYCYFDLNKSGARLVQEHFNLPNHWLIDYTEDRDLWKWELPNSKEVNAGIRQTPFDFYAFDELDFDNTLTVGEVVLKVENNIIKSLASKAYITCLDGYFVPIVNSPILQSEIGAELAVGQPFAIVTFNTETHTIYSLRSENGKGVRVNDIAKRHGGGGHPHAAGFKVLRSL